MINSVYKFVKDYPKHLFSVKGKKGMFSIILTATILTIFEIVFFYKIVAPGVKTQMDVNIRRIGKKIQKNIDETNKPIKEKSPIADIMVTETTNIILNKKNENVLYTFSTREGNLINKINNYTVYTGVLIVLSLCILMYIIWGSIKNDPRILLVDSDNGDMRDSILTSIFTVFILISFQVLFYFFGQEFKYPGSMGNEELLNEIIKSIDA